MAGKAAHAAAKGDLSAPLLRLEDSTRRILHELQREEHADGAGDDTAAGRRLQQALAKDTPRALRASIRSEPPPTQTRHAMRSSVHSNATERDAAVQQLGLARQQQLLQRSCQRLEVRVRAADAGAWGGL